VECRHNSPHARTGAETAKKVIMTYHEDVDEKSISDLQGLKEIKKQSDILSRIKRRVTPRMVMEPWFLSNSEDLQKLREITGFLFSIESPRSPPALMLMKVGRMDITNTVGNIDEIPQDYITNAIKNPPEPPSHGMHPITEEIKKWLQKEPGLQQRNSAILTADMPHFRNLPQWTAQEAAEPSLPSPAGKKQLSCTEISPAGTRK